LGRRSQIASLGFLVVLASQSIGCRGSQAKQSNEIRDEAVQFASDGAKLSGSLYLPAGKPPFSAVVLFHGSGAQSRDLFTAHWFAEQGVAALGYDKRGVGDSTGDFRSVPFMDLADDGLAAVQFLKSRRDIDARHIGVWGLSQGGWLGPLAASRSSDVAFVVAVSGPGVSPGEQMIFYYAEELRAAGMKESDVVEASTVRRTIWTYLSSGQNYEAVKKAMADSRSKSWYAEVKAQQDNLFEPLPTPDKLADPNYRYARWFKKEAIYDPVPALRALKVPALFLFGDEDRLVPVPESVSVIRGVANEASGKDFTITVIHGADHGMRLGGSNYSQSSEYLDDMRTWLHAHVPNLH
jgi:pimeloyl-ACP methyl ester carboxylesterase